jgi:IS1 family transposase
MPQTASEVQLKRQTQKSFEAYIRDAEAEMEQTQRDPGSFLWSDSSAERAERVRRGEIVAEFCSGQGPVKIASGLIHDWIGAAWMPNTTLKATLALIQNYDNHANIYKPEVIASKLKSRSVNDFEIYLRLLKKKIVTVVLDTDHSVHYSPVDRSRWVCQSHTTRIAEVENAGCANERVLPPDTGFGFLWRLNSYWRFQEREVGVYAECRAISLTRDVPLGLGWIIEPIIQKLPKESLIHTLECTRQALLVG